MKLALIYVLLILGGPFIAAAVGQAAAEETAETRPGVFGFTTSMHESVEDGERRVWLVVRGVALGGASHEAGIRRGDAITAINGEALEFSGSLEMLRAFGRFPAGKRVEFTILREQRELKVVVVPGTMSDQQFEQWQRMLEMVREEQERGDAE